MKLKFFFTSVLAGVFSLFVPLHAAAQDIEAGRAKSQAYAACHGADGNSQPGQFPNLAGQTWRYIYIQLKDYKEGRWFCRYKANERVPGGDPCQSLKLDGFALPTHKTGRQTTSRCSPPS